MDYQVTNKQQTNNQTNRFIPIIQRIIYLSNSVVYSIHPLSTISFLFNEHSLYNLLGSLAGATAVMFTYPLDVARVRLAVGVTKKNFNGVFDCISTIAKKEGIAGVYRGMSPTLMVLIQDIFNLY